MNHSFHIVSKEQPNMNNPFVIGFGTSLVEQSGIVNLVHTPELANSLFEDFDFTKIKINESTYWFNSFEDIEEMIFEILSMNDYDLKVIYEDRKFEGDVFYVQQGNSIYLLNDDKFFYSNASIVSKLNGTPLSLPDNYIGYDALKVKFKEYGMLDEVYNEKSFVSLLESKNLIHAVLPLYRFVHGLDSSVVYTLGEDYNNPYENILKVEEYLNSVEIYTIDINKCNDYELEFDKLPARYEYTGFYTTTGRIFCRSHSFASLQNLSKEKRDVLYADKNCYLMEFDFKSFEYDIICQILGIEHEDDPHIEIYDKLIDFEVDNSRLIGKKINYSLIYGMTPNRLFDSLLQEVEGLDNDYRETFLRRLSNEEVFIKFRELETRLQGELRDGKIKNYFGRNLSIKKTHAVLANYISSTAADYIYYKFLRVLDLLRNTGDDRNKIILQNHDSILMQVSFDTIDRTDLILNIKEELQLSLGGISGHVDFTYGHDWKNME